MHYLCIDHQDEAVLFDAFGWLPAEYTSALHTDMCEVCTGVWAEIYDLALDDLAESRYGALS